jgi:hypothetical protein
MTKLPSHLFSLLAVALVAFAGVESPHYGTATFLVVLIGGALIGAVALKFRSPRKPVAAVVGHAPAAQQRGSFVTTKRVMIAFMALGIAAYVGGQGTFATFSAETANPNGQVSSGTLTMTDQVNTGTACASINAQTADNTNAGYGGSAPALCQGVLNLTNLAPGAYDGVSGASLVTITNTGTLDASKFYLYASWVKGPLSTALVSGASPTTIAVSSLAGEVFTGDSLTISYGTHGQVCTAGSTNPGSATTTTITISSCVGGTYNFSYPLGSTVLDKSSNNVNGQGAQSTNCYDSQTTAAVDGSGATVTGGSFGTQLNFNPITGNPMCSTALIWIQEVTFSSGVIQPGIRNFCWVGNGVGSAVCNAPVSALLTATSNGGSSPYSVTAGTTSLTFSAGLKGNIKSGDSVIVTDKTVSATATCTAGADADIGATTVTVSSCGTLVNNTAFTTGNTYVTDQTTLNTLNSDTTHTISNFDTLDKQTGELPLYPVTNNVGGTNTSALVFLNRSNTANSATQPGSTRYFYVGVYLPAPASGSQNQLQGLMSTFGITWHLDQ